MYKAKLEDVLLSCVKFYDRVIFELATVGFFLSQELLFFYAKLVQKYLTSRNFDKMNNFFRIIWI